MKALIVGLGLIGGSLAKQLKKNSDWTVAGFDIDAEVCSEAKMNGAVDDVWQKGENCDADITILCLSPVCSLDFLRENAPYLKPGSVVTDVCGVKQAVVSEAEDICEKCGLLFIGGHPMAGTQFWGFGSSRASLFKGASMILTPCGISDIAVLDKAKHFFLSLGFSEITFSSPEEHDRIIAYTSQLAHVVSSAYVKSPSAEVRKGFSAGSYKDMTRVAKLNEEMWTELFLENKDNLAFEIDTLIKNLQQYKTVIENADSEKLSSLLSEGKAKKKQVG